jgi:hypothetical protein
VNSIDGDADATGVRPALRIVAGNPTEEELAAVTVVLSALAARPVAEPTPVQPAGGWADPAHRVRVPLHPGPGAWQASARPSPLR